MNDYERFKEKFFRLWQPINYKPQKVKPYKVIDKNGNTLVAPSGKTIFKQERHAKSSVKTSAKTHLIPLFCRSDIDGYLQQMIDEGLIEFVPVED